MTPSESEDHLMHIRRGGCDIEGHWRVTGDEVLVECPYGSDHAPFAGASPMRVAEILIARLAFAALGGQRLEPSMI
jgi:hypothetical protein